MTARGRPLGRRIEAAGDVPDITLKRPRSEILQLGDVVTGPRSLPSSDGQPAPAL
jgi:hypothetical protein